MYTTFTEQEDFTGYTKIIIYFGNSGYYNNLVQGTFRIFENFSTLEDYLNDFNLDILAVKNILNAKSVCLVEIMGKEISYFFTK